MGSSELLCVALLAGTGTAYYYDVPPVYVSVAMSVVAGLLTYLLIPAAAQLFINARLYGIDLSKSTTDVKVYGHFFFFFFFSCTPSAVHAHFAFVVCGVCRVKGGEHGRDRERGVHGRDVPLHPIPVPPLVVQQRLPSSQGTHFASFLTLWACC